MLTLHGAATVLALRGQENQLVEVEKPVVEVIDKRHNQNIKFTGQTLTQIKDYLKDKYGVKFKSGNEIKLRLQKLGREDLIAQTPRSILSDYVPTQYLQEVYQLLTGGNRQMLLGE